MIKKIYFLAAILLIASFVQAAEVDQYARLRTGLVDSSPIINDEANRVFDRVAKQLTGEKISCSDEMSAYKALRKHFNNHIFGKYTKWIISNPEISKYSVSLEDSVYRDWSLWDGVGMGFTLFSNKGVTMANVVLIGEQPVGIDKFEHMFGQGFMYYRKHYMKKDSLAKTLRFGAKKENLLLGGMKYGNGVFSYGDLGANFNGMRFWNHVLQKHDDLLGTEYNFGPYLTCNKGKWEKGEDVDFRNYMDASMDESINCSKFPTKKTANKFKSTLKRMGLSCPMDLAKRDELVVKYGKITKYIINLDGIDAINGIGDLK